MDFLEAALLGLIQGLTEFLPVSSSGHLEIAKYIMQDESIQEKSFLFTVVLHMATALSTIIVFWKDIVEIVKGIFKKDEEHISFVLKIIVSMIPAVIVGVLFDDIIESFFHQKIVLVAFMLFVTGFLLFIADRAKSTDQKITYGNALIIGIAQMIAILPGISRSGATIATSVLLGIDRYQAARFSFLMVVPLIFGKMAKDILDGELSVGTEAGMELAVGFITALITGILACTWMISIVKNSKLKYFAYYCFIVATAIIVYFYTK